MNGSAPDAMLRSLLDRLLTTANLLRTTRRELVEESFDVPPHGRVLHLRRPSGTAVLERDAVWQKLCRFSDGQMPYVGILVDLGGANYQVSSADLGGVGCAIAAWARGWVAPCAIVLNERSGAKLQHLLKVTQLHELDELQVVESEDAARRHISSCLDRRAVQQASNAPLEGPVGR